MVAILVPCRICLRIATTTKVPRAKDPQATQLCSDHSNIRVKCSSESWGRLDLNATAKSTNLVSFHAMRGAFSIALIHNVGCQGSKPQSRRSFTTANLFSMTGSFVQVQWASADYPIVLPSFPIDGRAPQLRLLPRASIIPQRAICHTIQT